MKHRGIRTGLKDGRSDLIALLVSVLFSLVFLTSFALSYQPSKPQPHVLLASGPPPKPVEVLQPPPARQDPNEKFRVVPENFADADFRNWSYGRYRFWGKRLTLSLSQGQVVHEWKEGGGGETFLLTDVFYTDLTGDGKPEAIVMLSHVECGGSCDGGSDLFYIYENRNGTVRRIWEYETGSMANGCGLKSFTVTNKQIAVEMFGHCWEPASSFDISGKYIVRDLTRAVFHFNGRRFVKKLTEITAAPAKELRNYRPEVHIKN